MITIVDYGMGNVGSILNMYFRLGIEACVASEIEGIEKAEKLILPGVGAFDNAMSRLGDMDLIDVLNHRVLKEHVPVLGICLGMQLLSNRSEEGSLPGLGWINAETIRFNFSNFEGPLKVPHMGWNTLEVQQTGSVLDKLPDDHRFYFVHSYHVQCADSSDVLATTHYGIKFHSALRHGNIYGMQFHPEKSHRFGLTVLKNYAMMGSE